MKRTWIWTIALLLLVPAAAGAQTVTKTFQNYCTTGSVRTCASVQVTTAPYKQGKTVGTEVWIRIRNLQGTHATDNTGGSLVTKLGLTAPDVGMASSLSVTYETPAEAIWAANDKYPGEYWGITDKPIGGPIEFSTSVNGTKGGIQGCDSSRANPPSYFRTCGDAGWIVFHFVTDGSWTADQAEIAYGVQAVQLDDGSYQCRSGENCFPDESPPTTEVVPEPATMVLMGSGLLGITLARRRRRRTGELEPE